MTNDYITTSLCWSKKILTTKAPISSNHSMSLSYPVLLSKFSELFHLGGKYPPALVSGLVIFLISFYIVGVFTSLRSSLALDPWALYHLNLNKISLYPLVHSSFLHLFFNIFALISPLSLYERSNGTVHTGVVLNVLAVVTALPYCVLGMVFFPKVSVVGASAWCFSFFGYYSYLQSLSYPTFKVQDYEIPTIATPFILLVASALIFPGSSFIGHLLGLLSGFALAKGYLKPLIEPSSKVISWLEERLEKYIDMIPLVDYYKEKNVQRQFVNLNEDIETQGNILGTI
ncbi:GQ67_02139T0 [Komagataella phaffii]|nr:GQ67_02139T0 [Komagataella phaffii]AOA66830.1 GQ68_02154T0 [Komagataella phaffii GS115]